PRALGSAGGRRRAGGDRRPWSRRSSRPGRPPVRSLRHRQERRHGPGARPGQADGRNAPGRHRRGGDSRRRRDLCRPAHGTRVTERAQILLVDDEANIRRMLAALLREEGFTVAEAANGNAARLQVDDGDPDAVVLDLLMPPGPDGLETLTALRDRGRTMPVIMMSGKAQLTDAVRAVKLGAFQFLEKPLTPESVLVTVRAALELNRTRAENRALQAELGRRWALGGGRPAVHAGGAPPGPGAPPAGRRRA